MVEAGVEALADGHTHYCPAPGSPALREACAEHLSRHRGLADRARPGAWSRRARSRSCSSVSSRRAIPGDEVIYPNPGFPIYESVIRWAGATPVPLPLTEESGFAFTADDLAERLDAADEARDPELACATHGRDRRARAERRDRRAACRATMLDPLRRGLLARCSTTPTHDTIAAHEGLLERTILLDGFSKTFAMTGWRLGYAALPAAARRADHEAADQLGLLHGASSPARRRRGADRAAGRDRRDARGVPPAPRRRRRGLNALPAGLLRQLRAAPSTPSRTSAHRASLDELRRPPARRGRGRRPRRHRVRRIRRGVPAALVRELAREHRGGDSPRWSELLGPVEGCNPSPSAR